MSESDWFEVTSGPGLRQGDLLTACPVVTLAGPFDFPLPADFQPSVDITTIDVVILTQSCDLTPSG